MNWTAPILILLLFILAIMSLLRKGSSWNDSSPNLPPGPRTIPILGNLYLMDLKRPFRTMIKLSKEYGPVFRIKLGFREMVVLTGYETVKEALVNQADVFAERAALPIFEEFAKGFGVVFAHGENWKVMRRFTLSTLRDYGVGRRTLEDKINEECNVFTKTIKTYAGKPFEVKTIMTAAVSNIIVSILLGRRYDYEDPTFLRLLRLINENVRLSATPAILLYNLFPILGVLLGSRKIGMQIIPLLSSVLHDESQWEKPHEFYPEHFLDSEEKFLKKDAFLPFSADLSLFVLDISMAAFHHRQLSKEYGPIFRIKLGFHELVVLTGYETVKEALVNQADVFVDKAAIPIFEEFAKGFVGRRTLEDKITEECSVLMKRIKTYAGKPFEIKTIMTAAVSNIIVSILLGKRYDYEDPTFLRLLRLINENVRLSATPSILLYNLFPMLGVLLGSRKRIMNNRKKFHDFIQATFIEHLKDLDENDQRSFIDSFLVQQREENKKMTNAEYFHNENLKALVLDLFGAGTETTANTLRWAILLMMKYPDIQSKHLHFIGLLIGDLQPRTEHRAEMPYTDAVIHEVQRFADIVPTSLPRSTSMDITFKGFFIRKGMQISRRACAGENLAKTELFLFFTSLLQGFTFQPPPGTSKDDLDLTPDLGLSTPPMPYKTCAVLR
ncbi:cytochrome P450 2K1-like [Python bivittatus]|uniref:Cytochrome P450 2K1-like n=1 Tax=Python bivittatus TaxID=176946 RepID=A0A9F5J1I9_PYTBI|nr:cytochrome P450 2K1-like [Python bivittatus]